MTPVVQSPAILKLFYSTEWELQKGLCLTSKTHHECLLSTNCVRSFNYPGSIAVVTTPIFQVSKPRRLEVETGISPGPDSERPAFPGTEPALSGNPSNRQLPTQKSHIVLSSAT